LQFDRIDLKKGRSIDPRECQQSTFNGLMGGLIVVIGNTARWMEMVIAIIAT
jgi:hypothetical protein